LRLACEDLKAYYFEAVGAQPGARAAAECERWFWRDTIASKVFFELERVCANSADESVRAFGTRHLIPRAVARAPGSQP
ncbi:MAG: hypothetical protein HY323_09830, partial [Betaproteobacteria bacterium]|nr:hypothetical protein [Betaproteobacteria bacterium]